MILLHILGGLVGLASGAVALSAPKGARLHRRSGTIFVYAMMVLSASGAVMAALKPERVSVIAGLLTFYLVLTALLTVRHRGQAFHWMDIAAMSFGLTVGITGVIFGLSTGEIDGPPPVMAFVFGAVALLAVFGDVRMLLAQLPVESAHRASLVAYVPGAVDRDGVLLSGAGGSVPGVAADHALVVHSGTTGNAADGILARARPVYTVAPACKVRLCNLSRLTVVN